MRRTLAVAAVVAAAAFAPLSPASAVCGWTLEGMQHCGNCLESEVAQEVDAVTAEIREEHGVRPLNEQIVCAH